MSVVLGYSLVGALATGIGSAVAWAIGFAIGLLFRKVAGLRYLSRIWPIALGLAVLYVIFGIVAAIMTASTAASGQPPNLAVVGLLRVEDVLAKVVYLLWFLAGLGLPARRRWNRPAGPPPVSVALG